MQRDILRRNEILHNPWFNNVEKDKQQVIEELFVKDKVIANQVKSLLCIPYSNCLSEIDKYSDELKAFTLKKLREEKYITFTPKATPDFNDEKQCYMIVTNNFITPNDSNSAFHNYMLNVYCMCQFGIWELEDFRERPLKLSGIVVGLLNNRKMSGIGKAEWIGTSHITANDQVAGYVNSFKIIYGQDSIVNG